jgi:hypothetical protein
LNFLSDELLYLFKEECGFVLSKLIQITLFLLLLSLLLLSLSKLSLFGVFNILFDDDDPEIFFLDVLLL